MVIFKKITFSKSHFWQNSHFWILIFDKFTLVKSQYFDKLHVFKVSFFTKFAFSISHFFHKIRILKISFFTKFTFFKNQIPGNFWIKSWILPQCEHETCFASFQTACIHMQVVYKKSNRITAILMALGKVGHNKVLSIEQRIMDWGIVSIRNARVGLMSSCLSEGSVGPMRIWYPRVCKERQTILVKWKLLSLLSNRSSTNRTPTLVRFKLIKSREA